MNFKYPRTFIKDFVMLYRDKVCLWRRSHPDYRNAVARQLAMEDLLDKMREFNPDADKRHIRLQLEHWRANYRFHLRRLLKSAKPDYQGPIWVPNHWAFPLFTFLHEEDYPALPALCQAIGLPAPEDVDTRQPAYKTDESGDEESKKFMTPKQHRAVLVDLLRTYRKYTILWRPKDYVKCNGVARRVASRALLTKYRQIYPKARNRALVQRLLSCRDIHRRELKRVLTARARGEVYESKVWYFREMYFLNKYEAKELSHLLLPEEIVNTDDEIMETVDENSQDEASGFEGEGTSDEGGPENSAAESPADKETEIEPDNSTALDIAICKSNRDRPYNKPITPSIEASRMIRKNIPILPRPVVEKEPVQLRVETPTTREDGTIRLYKMSESLVDDSTPTVPKDRFDVVGENVACKLRYLDREQRIRAEKLINDIMYYAELNSLDRHSALVIAEAVDEL